MAVVLITCLAVLFCGCDFDKWGQDIANKTVDAKIQAALTEQDKLPYDPNGTILYETILIEDALREGVLKEDVLEENTLKELLLQEELQKEDVIIESVSVQLLDSIEDLEDYFVCESNYSEQLDYSFIKQRIAIGASMVIAEVVVDLASCVLDIVTCNWGSLALDAGQIVVTVKSTTLATFVGYQVALAKSLAAGNSYEIAMYDALDSSSKAFYYTAVTCEVVNTVISIAQGIKAVTETVKSIKDIVKLSKSGKILDASGRVVAKTGSDGIIKVKKDAKWVSCDYASNSTDLYDVATKEYVATISKSSDDSVELITKQIPEKVYSKSGNLKYYCDGNDVYKVVKKATGYSGELKGTIDAGGFIKKGGQIIDRIDFTTGKSIDAYSGIAKTAPNISCDAFGNFIDLNTGKELSTKIVNDTISYLDSKGATVFKQYAGKDGSVYLKRMSDIDNGKTIGRLLDDGKRLDSTWKADLNEVRYKATQKIRKGLVEYVQTHSLKEVRANFPNLTQAQIDYIGKYGKVPTSLQIHHCKNVANYPDYAGDLSNLQVLTLEEHLKAHGGNYQNSTNSPFANYIDLVKLFGL